MLEFIIAFVISIAIAGIGLLVMKASENPIVETFGVVIALTGVMSSAIMSLLIVRQYFYM